jgi:hypothetical protein
MTSFFCNSSSLDSQVAVLDPELDGRPGDEVARLVLLQPFSSQLDTVRALSTKTPENDINIKLMSLIVFILVEVSSFPASSQS